MITHKEYWLVEWVNINGDWQQLGIKLDKKQASEQVWSWRDFGYEARMKYVRERLIIQVQDPAPRS